MKEFYIGQLRTDDEIQDFFMVKAIAIKIGSNKKQYLDLVLSDKSGELTAKKWDVADTELPSLNEIGEGDVVKLKANVTEWNGMRQLRVLKLRKSVPEDSIELADYIKAAPEKAEDMYRYILDRAEEMKDEELRKLCVRVLTDHKEKLMYYPAASKNHHAELAGLLYHMKRMLLTAERICEVYLNLNRDLVAAGVIIHDIEKINEIDADTLGMASGYSFEGQLLGHLVQGIKSIDRLAEELKIGREKTIMLEHMILSHHYEPEFGSPKKPLFPEAEILHYLDMIDARMYDMQEALDATSPGEFSDRVWTLDNRKLYKPESF
ncbi:MAG TPA: HD domain-containing protein [Bacillota bacterium]|nr:HD domain-containing protein [Bacillota bacterium]